MLIDPVLIILPKKKAVLHVLFLFIYSILHVLLI